jgi:hypothetical protein
MALVGDIRSFKLNSLFQLITMEGKSGVLTIENQSRQAKCYFQTGRLYHCSLSKLKGASAFFELLTWESGSFSFNDRGRIDLRSVYEPIDSLLIQGSKQLEEWRIIKNQGPFPDEVFEVSGEIPSAMTDFSMTPDHWKILRLVDGKLTCNQLAEKSGLGYLASYRILFDLKSSELIRSLEYKLLNMTLIPIPSRGKSLFVPRGSLDDKVIGVETAMQDLVYRKIDGKRNLKRIMNILKLDQKWMSMVVTQLFRRNLISLIDSEGNMIPLDRAGIGER